MTWYQSNTTLALTASHPERAQFINRMDPSSSYDAVPRKTPSVRSTQSHCEQSAGTPTRTIRLGKWSNAAASTCITSTPSAAKEEVPYANVDNAYYMEQIDSAVHKLVAMYTSNNTTPKSIYDNLPMRATAVTLPSNNLTTQNPRASSTKSSAIPSLRADLPDLDEAHFDLFFLNATSPSYLLIDRTNTGRGNNNLVMMWQAPTNDSSTSTIAEFLAITKNFYAWAEFSYYWAKIVFFATGSVYALYRAITLIKAIRSLHRERDAHRDMPEA
jgi:hypothetical protein